MKLEKIAILSLWLVPITAMGCIIFLGVLYLSLHRGADLRLVAWNVESGGNDPNVIAEQLKDFHGYDVVALNEVAKRNVEAYQMALGREYESFVSATGRNDHLAILWNSERFDVLSKEEMNRYGDYRLNDGNHRSPIFVRLKDKATGRTFIFMTNHLARRNKQLRKEQAAGLREWARDSNEAIIAMGDFNFDYSFIHQSGNESFVEFMRDGVWSWVKPNPMVDSNFSDSDGDGQDNYPDSMLDFVFLANAAKGHETSCRIIQRDGDFPDDDSTSDHRATELEVELH